MSKVALITGASQGIGKAVALNLATQGYKVAIADCNDTDGEKLASQIQGDFYKVDVTSWSQQIEAFEKTFKKHGRIDFVFANAGVSERVDYFAPDIAQDLDPKSPPNLLPLQINLAAVIYTSIIAARFFRKNNATEVEKPLLVLTASPSGIYPTPTQPIYAASKAGVVGLTRSLGPKFQEEGFRVCALLPGLVATGILPAEAYELAGASLLTTVDQIVEGVIDLLNNDKNGAICEVSKDNRWYRDPYPYLDNVQRQVNEELGSLQTFRKIKATLTAKTQG